MGGAQVHIERFSHGEHAGLIFVFGGFVLLKQIERRMESHDALAFPQHDVNVVPYLRLDEL